MNNHLSRWRYTCIRPWRELAFRLDRNELNQVVIMPLILKMGRVTFLISLFHIPHRLPGVRRWFGEDHLPCFCRDVLSRVDECVPFFYPIRYSPECCYYCPWNFVLVFDEFHVEGMKSSWLGATDHVWCSIKGYCCTLVHCCGHTSSLSSGNQWKKAAY